VLWGNTNGGDKKGGFGVDDDVDEFIEFALGVVVAAICVSIGMLRLRVKKCLLCLSGTTAYLRKQEINSEWCILVLQVTLEFCDLLAQHVWCIANSANDAQATSVRDGSGKFGACSDVHTSQHDWVVDLQEISRCGSDLLCIFLANVWFHLADVRTWRCHDGCSVVYVMLDGEWVF
jgi:hypothetical protein